MEGGGGGGGRDVTAEQVLAGEGGFELEGGVCGVVMESGEREESAVLSRHPMHDVEVDEGGGLWRAGRYLFVLSSWILSLSASC